MTIERMIQLLEIEHECMLRASDKVCDRKCELCPLVQSDDELDEMYQEVVKILRKQI